MDPLSAFRTVIHVTTPIPLVGRFVVLNAFHLPPPRTIPLGGELLAIWESRRTHAVHAGRRIAVHTWPVRRPTKRVLYVHGWANNARVWMRHVRVLRDRGVEVVAMDLPAHGESEGHRGDARRFMEALHGVLDDVGPVDAVVGHSAGAATVSGVLVDSDLGPARAIPAVVMLGCPAGLDAMFDYFQAKLGLGGASREQVERAFDRRFGPVFRHARVGARLAAARPRTLLVHDEHDASVPIGNLDRVLQHAGRAAEGFEVLRTRGLGHQGVLHDAAVVERVADFLTDGGVSP